MAFEGHIHLPSSSSNAAPSATATPPEEAGGPRCSQSSQGLGTDQRRRSTLRSQSKEMSDNEQEESRSNGHDEPKVAMKQVGLEFLLGS